MSQPATGATTTEASTSDATPSPSAPTLRAYRIVELGDGPAQPATAVTSASSQQASPAATDQKSGATANAQPASATATASGKVKATLEKSKFTTTETTLAAVRQKLGASVIDPEQRFCYADGSLAADTVAISEYLEIASEANPKPPMDTIYISRPSEKTAVQTLALPPFLLLIFEWSTTPNDPSAAPAVTSKGTLHSDTLLRTPPKSSATPTTSAVSPTPAAPPAPAASAVTMTLAGLRKKIPGMSSFSKVHQFCTPSGSTVTDETLTIPQYLSLEPSTESTGSGNLPTFKVFFKTTQAYNNPTTVQIPPDIKADTTLTAIEPSKTATTFQKKTRTSLIEASIAVGAEAQSGAGYLDDKQWAKVLSNCGVFYGWVVDRQADRIVRAPKAAFQLRSKISEDPVSGLPDYAPVVTVTDVSGSPGNNSSVSDLTNDTKGSSEESNAGNDGPSDSSAVTEPSGLTPAATTHSTQTIPRTKTDLGIPNFRINDDSRIEVTACEHEFEKSMATNDFSSQSTEASMSGGYAGFSVAVSAGVSKSSSHSTKHDVNTYEKTLVARYLYPRCDLFLYPDDLEPTPELAAAVAQVRATKNIKQLRKIHADFGHLFCQALTLGGRLQSTKIIQITTTSSEDEQKSQFKVSVGLSVSTPVGVGASAKSSTEIGQSGTTNVTTQDQKESNVFEAVGGDTILANNPALWAPTVAKHEFWRVIDRDALAPLADIMAAMPGYREVKSWFIQAVPAVAKYIELDDSRQVVTRFRLLAPLNGLSLRSQRNPTYYLGHRKGLQTNPWLMGVDVKNVWGPMKAYGMEYSKDVSLFSPHSIRAPVLIGYLESKAKISVGNDFGSTYSEEYTETQWNVSAPFSDALTHGSRIILCTNPYASTSAQAPQNAPAAATALAASDPGKNSNSTGQDKEPGAGNKPPAPISTPDPPLISAPSHMVVFRNQQGVFQPAMSDSDENQYWRILKTGCTTEGEHIKEGDEVRFCWAFRDQVTGFRDYVDDVFGRRRNQCPPELEDTVLYLKLPWPRFEREVKDLNSGLPPVNSMVLAPIASVEPQAVDLKVLPANGGAYTYVLQDVSFRIDTVANAGRGDTGDYMLKDVAQNDTRLTLSFTLPGIKLGAAAFYF